MAEKLYYTYNEIHVSGGDDVSDEEWSDRTHAYYSWSLEDVSADKPPIPLHSAAFVGAIVNGEWKERPAKAGDDVWVVVVIYGDGDTFGSSSGHGTVACICVDGESAVAAQKKIQEGWEGPNDYAIWKGYFADLQSVQIKRRIVFS